MSRIHRLEATPIRTDIELEAARETIDRLARAVLLAGTVLGIAFFGAFVLLFFRV